MSLILKDYLQKINSGEKVSHLLKQEEERVSTLKFLVNMHSFKREIVNAFYNHKMEKFYLQMQINDGTFVLYPKIQLLYKLGNGELTNYSSNESINKMLSEHTSTLFKKSLLLEAPNLNYFSEELTNGKKIVINLNDINEINNLPNVFLSSHLNALYQKTILDMELDSQPEYQNNKTKKKI